MTMRAADLLRQTVEVDVRRDKNEIVRRGIVENRAVPRPFEGRFQIRGTNLPEAE
jgi:hypothetical protein